MARLDLSGLQQLWYRIDDIFARVTEAARSIVLSGTSLVMRAGDGGELSTVDLGGTFATDNEAAHSLSLVNDVLDLKNVGGASLAQVNMPYVKESTTDGRYATGLDISGTNLALTRRDGGVLDRVTLPTQDMSDYATKDWVNKNFFASARVEAVSGGIMITFYDGEGTMQDYVSFSVG